jgi:hypothetical protein
VPVQPLRARRDYGAVASRVASRDADIAKLLAQQYIDDAWTTAEDDWKRQAKANMKMVDHKWHGGRGQMVYVFETKAINKNPVYTTREMGSTITITLSAEDTSDGVVAY